MFIYEINIRILFINKSFYIMILKLFLIYIVVYKVEVINWIFLLFCIKN